MTDISLTVHGTPAHVKCYSYHAGTSVTVSGGGRNATVHDFFFLSLLGWHTLPSHASAKACLTGYPNAQHQGKD